MEHLVGFLGEQLSALSDVALDVSSHAATRISRTVQKVRVIDLRVRYRGHGNFGPPVGTAFHDGVPLPKILEPLREDFSAIERLRGQHRIRRGKLEKNVRSDREERGSEFRRKLFKELVCTRYRSPKLAGLTENRFDVAPNEVLDLIDVDREERTLFPREEGILDCREDETSEREGLVPKSALGEIDENPIPLVHRFLDRERRMRLPKDVAEVRIGDEGADFVQHGFPDCRLHRIAHLAVARFEILPDLGVRNELHARRPESGISEEERKFDQRQSVRRKHEKGVPQRLLDAHPEVIESAPSTNDFCHVCRADEVGCFLFERVEADRDNGVSGLDEDQLVAQVSSFAPFSRIDGAKRVRYEVAVRIEDGEATVGFNVLVNEVTQK